MLASPLAGWGSKQWPLEYYEEVAQELKMPLVVNGPPQVGGVAGAGCGRADSPLRDRPG